MLRARLRRHLAVVPFLIGAAVAPILVSVHVYPYGSPNLDELGYLSQAEALRHGDLTLPARTHAPSFLPYMSGVQDGKVIFKYQPVWPAVLALSEQLTGSTRPALALTGLASAVGLYLFALEVSRRRRVAALATALFTLSPFFLIQSGTYLAYPFSLAVLLAAAAVLLRGSRTGRTGLLVAAGALLGLAVLNRPYDAVLFGLPLAGWLVARSWRLGELVRRLGTVALGAAPFAVAFVVYDRLVTGQFLTPAFSVSGPLDTFGFGDRSSFLTNAGTGVLDFTPSLAWGTAVDFAASLGDWLLGGALLGMAALVGLALGRRRAELWLTAALGLMFPVGYFFWWGAANARNFHLHDLIGPFYWFPLLASVAVLGAEAIDAGAGRLVRRRASLRLPASVAVVAMLVLVSVVTFGDTRAWIDDARKVSKERAGRLEPPGPGRTLLLVAAAFANDPYVRTVVPDRLDAEHLVALAANEQQRFDLLSRFPGRTPYELIGLRAPDAPFGPEAWTRRRLRVRRGPTVELALRVPARARGYVRIVARPGSAPLTVAPDRRLVARLAPSVARAPAPAVSLPVGRTVQVAVGIRDPIFPTGRPAYELRYGVRVVQRPSGPVVEVIDPPRPFHRYAFPNRAPVWVNEDVSAVITPAG